MKKITSFLMMFMLFVGMGWAQGTVGSTISELSGISNKIALGISTGSRGALAYVADGTKLTGMTSPITEANPSLQVQQFALLRTSNTPADCYYVYSVNAKKFMAKGTDGHSQENTAFGPILVDTPTDASLFKLKMGTGTGNLAGADNVLAADYPWVLQTRDSNPYIFNFTSYHDFNGLKFMRGASEDVGNRLKLTVAAENQDFTSAVEKIKKFESEGLPFKVSYLTEGKFGADMHWYLIKLNGNDGKFSGIKYNLINGKSERNEANNTVTATAQLYAFVGNKLEGFEIYNRAAGADKILWSENTPDSNTDPILMTPKTLATSNTRWIVAENVKGDSKGYSLKKEGTAYGYINNRGEALGYWPVANAANDNGSRFNFVEVTDLSQLKVPVKVQSTYKNEVFKETVQELTKGESLDLESYKVNIDCYGVKTGDVTSTSTTADDGVVVTVNYLENAAEPLPFKLSTLTNGQFGTDMHWYVMKIRPDNEKTVEYDKQNNVNNDLKNITTNEAKHYYALTGDPVHGYKFYNYVAGPDKVLWKSQLVNGAINMVPVTSVPAGRDWVMKKGTKDTHTGWYFRRADAENGYLHDYGDKLGYWIDGQATSDPGSFINFTEVNAAADIINAEKVAAKDRVNALKVKMPSILNDVTSIITEIEGVTVEQELATAISQIRSIEQTIWKAANGKIVTLQNNGNNGRSAWFLTQNDGLTGVYGQASIKSKMAWTLKYDETSKKLKFYNAATSRYWTNNPGHVTDNETEAGLYEPKFSTTVTGENKCAFVTSVDGAERMVHQATSSNVMNYVDINDAASIWTVMTEGDFLKAQVAKYEGYPNYVGGYSQENINTLKGMTTIQDEVLTPILLEPGKYYRLKNYSRDLSNTDHNAQNPGEGGFMTSSKHDEEAVVDCYKKSMSDAGAIWTLELVEGKYKLKNLNVDKYVGKTVAARSQYLVFAEAADAGLYDLKEVAPCQYTLSCSNGTGSDKELHVSGSGVMNFNGGANSPSAWHLIPATELEVNMATVNNNAYSSLYVPFAVQTQNNETQLYTATKQDATLTMHEVKSGKVPANNGLVLRAAANTPKVTLNILNEEVPAVEGGNALLGSNVKKTGETGQKYYVLSKGKTSKKIGFYLLPSSASNTLKANKAYVEMPGTASVNAFRMDFGETTGVEGVEVEEPVVNQVIYDLSGRRVAKMTKGLYIVNGKKVLVK